MILSAMSPTLAPSTSADAAPNNSSSSRNSDALAPPQPALQAASSGGPALSDALPAPVAASPACEGHIEDIIPLQQQAARGLPRDSLAASLRMGLLTEMGNGFTTDDVASRGGCAGAVAAAAAAAGQRRQRRHLAASGWGPIYGRRRAAAAAVPAGGRQRLHRPGPRLLAAAAGA